jgi:hypothetical protein
MTYLTVLFTVLLPVLGMIWARSYVVDDALYRIGRGRAVMLSVIRGEVAVWTGPARETGPVRYVRESSERGFGMTAAEILTYDRTARAHWVAGFGFAETYALTPREQGPVRCYVVPMWFLTALAAAFPLRVLMRHVKRSQAAVAAETACCRRCGAELDPGETRCHACSFPAFIRHGAVA